MLRRRGKKRITSFISIILPAHLNSVVRFVQQRVLQVWSTDCSAVLKPTSSVYVHVDVNWLLSYFWSPFLAQQCCEVTICSSFFLCRIPIRFLLRGLLPCRDTVLLPPTPIWRSPASTPPFLRWVWGSCIQKSLFFFLPVMVSMDHKFPVWQLKHLLNLNWSWVDVRVMWKNTQICRICSTTGHRNLCCRPCWDLFVYFFLGMYE